MKKRLISILLIFTLLVSLTPAADVKADASSDFVTLLNQKINKAAAYTAKNIGTFTVEKNSMDYYRLLESGYNMSSYKKAFFDSLDANLKADGHIDNKTGSRSCRDAGIGGAVLLILKDYGMDATAYQASDGTTYNLVDDFKTVPEDANSYGYVISPYYYSTAVAAAYSYGLDEYAKTMIDYEIKAFYTMGKGFQYAGYNCDSTTMFLSTILPYKEDYSAYVTDALNVIAKYEKTAGCCYTTANEANGDSTALALLAYSAIGNKGKAYSHYYNLITYYENSNGTYRWMIDQEGSLSITTKDALTGLCAFRNMIKNTGVAKYIKTIKIASSSYVYNGKTKIPVITAKNNAGYTLKKGTDYTVTVTGGKYVGTATVTYTFTNGYPGSISFEYRILPKGTSISKLKKAKKSFKVTYKKQSAQTTGYQIQYATSSGMSDAKTVGVTSYKTVSKTIKSLKSKQKYYVRVRTYKTVSGTQYYSAWSSKKTVTTK